MGDDASDYEMPTTATITVAMQKQRAEALWKKILEHLNNTSDGNNSTIPDDVDMYIRRKLSQGFVPPIFHAYCAMAVRVSTKRYEFTDDDTTALIHLFPNETGNDKSVGDSNMLGLALDAVVAGNADADVFHYP
jgi:hypothetical protein